MDIPVILFSGGITLVDSQAVEATRVGCFHSFFYIDLFVSSLWINVIALMN